jgi:hypothetical protein
MDFTLFMGFHPTFHCAKTSISNGLTKKSEKSEILSQKFSKKRRTKKIDSRGLAEKRGWDFSSLSLFEPKTLRRRQI